MAGLPARKKDRHTWADYRKWPDDERWEIIDGEAFAMSPAPTPDHQTILLNMAVELRPGFEGHPCRLFIAALDVKLADDTVVQPDLLVVCPPARVVRTHVEGPPKLVVEIVSPSSTRHDRVRKFERYARAGISEYWIVTAEGRLVEVFSLREGVYVLAGGYSLGETLRSPTFPHIALDVARIFRDVSGPEPMIVKEGPGPYHVDPVRRRKPSRVSS